MPGKSDKPGKINKTNKPGKYNKFDMPDKMNKPAKFSKASGTTVCGKNLGQTEKIRDK
jgi:CRISPR/Cas system-associated protein Cas7 (RAMP superfamily)